MHNGTNGATDGAAGDEPFSYLNLPTGELIDAVAAGGAVPGAGTVLALEGAYSAALVATVAALTLSKRIDRYKKFHRRARYILQKSIELKDELKLAADEDSRLFEAVFNARVARDSTFDPREHEIYKLEALKFLRIATELPLQMAANCLVISRFGFELYVNGFQSARGDSIVATCGARAAAQGAVGLVTLNLKPFINDPWARSIRKTALKFFLETQRLEREFGRHLLESVAPEVCP